MTRISSYTSKLSLDDFRADQKTIDGWFGTRNDRLGEAAKKLPDDIRKLIDVEWKRIAGLKDILIHEYDTLNSGPCGQSSLR